MKSRERLLGYITRRQVQIEAVTLYYLSPDLLINEQNSSEDYIYYVEDTTYFFKCEQL